MRISLHFVLQRKRLPSSPIGRDSKLICADDPLAQQNPHSQPEGSPQNLQLSTLHVHVPRTTVAAPVNFRAFRKTNMRAPQPPF
jgi:hypothetical protein